MIYFGTGAAIDNLPSHLLHAVFSPHPHMVDGVGQAIQLRPWTSIAGLVPQTAFLAS